MPFNYMLDEVIDVLTEQMIKDNFSSKQKEEEKYIVTKQDLYKFSIKLIKEIKVIYDESKK